MNLVGLLLIEGIVMCFVLLFICVVGIANGPVGLVVFYEQEVKERVIALGLTTRERIKKASAITIQSLKWFTFLRPKVESFCIIETNLY